MVSSQPTRNAFHRAGIRRLSRGNFPSFTRRRSHIQPTDPRVARVPTSQSRGRAWALLRLNSRQPRVRPGMAAGVNRAKMHRASDSRN